MSQVLSKDLKFFNWESIDGKTLQIVVAEDSLDGTSVKVVMGLDIKSGIHYVLHIEETVIGEDESKNP